MTVGDGIYEEHLHGFRVRVRSITIRGARGQWWEWSAGRRGFVRTGPSRGMQILYDSADVRGTFAEALHLARSAAERMARQAGWVRPAASAPAP